MSAGGLGIPLEADHPLADVARLSLLMGFAQPPAGGMLDWKMHLLRRWFHSSYLAHYRRLHSFAEDDLARWRLVAAAACLSKTVPAGEVRILLAFVETELERQIRS